MATWSTLLTPTDQVFSHSMPGEIDRSQVQRLVERGAQLVEVLPAEEYKEDHLPGAISLPLRLVDKKADHLLDRNRPVIVYCWDAA